jgi:hypothetical protein
MAQSNWGGNRLPNNPNLFDVDPYDDFVYRGPAGGGAYASPYSNPYSNQHGNQHSNNAGYGGYAGANGYGSEYERQYGQQQWADPAAGAAKPPIEDTKFSKPTDVNRMWGDDAIEDSKRHFKKCVFQIVQSRSGVPVHKEVTLLFAIPDNPVHSDKIEGTFCLEVNNPSSKVNAGFMFAKNINTPLAGKMTDHINTINKGSKDEVFASVIPEMPTALMIKQLAIGNVISTLSQPRPHGLFIKGIDNQTIVHTHACSWTPTQAYKAVIFPGQRDRVVYQSGSTASPHLEAIHGVHDCKKGASLVLDNWGAKVDNSKEKCRKVDIRSGYIVFLAYSMVDLIKQWIKEDPKNELPPGIKPENYQALLTMHEQWKASKVAPEGGRSIPIDIYHSASDLTDGYVGHVIAALTGVDQIAWTVAPEEPHYRVPEEFLKFAAKYYEQTISPITMTEHNGVEVQAEYINKSDTALMPELSKPFHLFFNTTAWIFAPRLFAIIKEIKAS